MGMDRHEMDGQEGAGFKEREERGEREREREGGRGGGGE
jgi:hypothetical protein